MLLRSFLADKLPSPTREILEWVFSTILCSPSAGAPQPVRDLLEILTSNKDCVVFYTGTEGVENYTVTTTPLNCEEASLSTEVNSVSDQAFCWCVATVFFTHIFSRLPLVWY